MADEFAIPTVLEIEGVEIDMDLLPEETKAEFVDNVTPTTEEDKKVYPTRYLVLKDDPPGIGGKIPDLYDKKNLWTLRANLFNAFKLMPRVVFETHIRNILPEVKTQVKESMNADGTIRKHVTLKNQKTVIHYANFLHVFNEANLAAMREYEYTEPWAWEAEKMRLYYLKSAEAQIADIEALDFGFDF